MSKTVFTIKCVDAHALYHALLRQQQLSHGNGVSGVKLDASNRWIADPPTLSFAVDRYAMDGNGYHVGYETFTGELPLYALKPVRALGGATPFSEWYVIPHTLDVDHIEPAEEPREYAPLEVHEFLADFENASSGLEYWGDQLHGWRDLDEDDQMQLADDLGMGEGDYYPPDDDFAFQELEHALNAALEDLPIGVFHHDEQGRYWTLQFADGEVVETYWIERYD